MSTLIYYHHGIGDVIVLMPQLRRLWYTTGEPVDLMCQDKVMASKLLSNCPYVRSLIRVSNPWKSGPFVTTLAGNYLRFRGLSLNYQRACFVDHLHVERRWPKTDTNSLYCELLGPFERGPEVFIPDSAQHRVDELVRERFPDGFVFRHTDVPEHRVHSWDAGKFIDEKWPGLPVINTGEEGDYHCWGGDINFAFALMRRASAVVLSSSVMVHAADALGVPISVLNYGKLDLYNLPVNRELVRSIRLDGQWADPGDVYRGLRPPENGIGRGRYLVGRIRIARARRKLWRAVGRKKGELGPSSSS